MGIPSKSPMSFLGRTFMRKNVPSRSWYRCVSELRILPGDFFQGRNASLKEPTKLIHFTQQGKVTSTWRNQSNKHWIRTPLGLPKSMNVAVCPTTMTGSKTRPTQKQKTTPSKWPSNSWSFYLGRVCQPKYHRNAPSQSKNPIPSSSWSIKWSEKERIFKKVQLVQQNFDICILDRVWSSFSIIILLSIRSYIPRQFSDAFEVENDPEENVHVQDVSSGFDWQVCPEISWSAP